jgi:hypothetical protein
MNVAEAVVTLFRALAENFPVVSEENQKKTQSG